MYIKPLNIHVSASPLCAAEASGAPSDAAPHGGLVQPAPLRRLLPRVGTSIHSYYIRMQQLMHISLCPIIKMDARMSVS